LIDVGRAVVAINGDHQRKTHGRFGCGDGDGKKGDHHADGLFRLRVKTPERDKIQVRCGQHHLNADEDENRVTPAQCSEQAD
jgi:hypothetical protein